MKRISVIFAMILLLCTAACAPSDPSAGPSETPPFSEETLQSGEVRYQVLGGKGYLLWGAVEGAEDYLITRSATLYGEFFVETSVGEETRYVVEDEDEDEDGLFDYFAVTAVMGDGSETPLSSPVSAFTNTLVVGPDDDMALVQAHIDEVHSRLETGAQGQFSSERFAVILLPGEYPGLDLKVGYYTTVTGAGADPFSVRAGKLSVSLNVLSNNNATCTFWRGAENFTVLSDTVWAVSQATSLRRMSFLGGLALSGSGWSSGGFLADSYVAGNIDPGTQQQWMTRNTQFGRWTSVGSFNFVFSGCEGKIPASNWTGGSHSTVLEKTERMAEKPYLVCEDGSYSVVVPEFRTNSAGASWMEMSVQHGYSLPLEEFYIANELTDTAATLNAALAEGKNIFFPAGHYRLDAPLKVTTADTVLLGSGYATLEITEKNTLGALEIADVGGVRVADLLIEAGPYSKNMVVVGEEGKHTDHASDPIVLSNLFLRIGGVKNVHTETDTALVIHADDTVGDNFWLWRADHSQGTAWEDTVNNDGSVSYGNPAETGLLVLGDDVQCYALMVEHFEGFQTDWRGEGGLTVMYQSETPYRVPSQEKWMSHGGEKRGCASYRVADGVKTHRGYGIGVYLVNYSGMILDSAMEAPLAEGVLLEHLVTTAFAAQNGAEIVHIVNDLGGSVRDGTSASYLTRFPA